MGITGAGVEVEGEYSWYKVEESTFGMGFWMKRMVKDGLGDEVAILGVCCNDGDDVIMEGVGTVAGFLGWR